MDFDIERGILASMEMLRGLFFSLGLFLLLTAAFPAEAGAGADWENLKTDHFLVFYKSGYEYQAHRALQSLENFRNQVEDLTGNNQPPLTAVAIQDDGDFSNGFTYPLDRTLQLSTEAPPPSLGLPMENWWTFLTIHEYTHMLHLNRVSGVPALLVDLFGTGFSPNSGFPAWIDEGFAVYSESRVSAYSGRLNDGLLDAYIGASAQKDHFPPLLKATFAPLEFPGDIMYKAGGGFHRYLADTYGEKQFSLFYGEYGGNLLSYISPLFPFLSLDPASSKAFGGKSIPELWKDWEEHEKLKKDDFNPDGDQLTQRGWDLEALCVSGGYLYYQRSYPVKTGTFSQFFFNQIRERDLATGKEREVVSTTSQFTSPLRVHGGKLYYGTAQVREGFANSGSFGYFSLLHERELASGRDRIVLEEQLQGFDILPDGKVLYSLGRKGGFGSDLWILDPATRRKKILCQPDLLVKEVAADSERVVVTAQKEWGSFNIYELHLEDGSLEALVPSPFIERNPQLVEGKLIFNANFGRKYSIYAYDFSTGEVSRLTGKGYAAWPAYDEEGKELYFASLGPDGFDLCRRPYESVDFTLPEAEPSLAPEDALDEAKIRKGDYLDNLGWLAPRSLHAPVAWFNDYHSWLGLGLIGSDALQQFSYFALPVYNFRTNRPEVDFSLSNQFFAPWASSLTYRGIDDNNLYIQTDYPLLVNLSPGMSQLLLGAALEFTDDFTRTVWEPYLSVGFSYPATRASLFIAAPLERRNLQSNRDRTAAYLYSSIVQYLPQSQLRLGGLFLEDPQNSDTVFPTLRGYSDALAGHEGAAFSADYSIPFLFIHGGLWNPSVYFQDLVLDLFSDQAFDDQGGTQWSYGAELHLETKLTSADTGLPNDLGVRFSRNQDGVSETEVFFRYFDLLGLIGSNPDTPQTNGDWVMPPGGPRFEAVAGRKIVPGF